MTFSFPLLRARIIATFYMMLAQNKIDEDDSCSVFTLHSEEVNPDNLIPSGFFEEIESHMANMFPGIRCVAFVKDVNSIGYTVKCIIFS
jgi:hypothetical protein